MECKKVREEIVPLLLGELDASKAGDVREHLDACESCRHEERLIRAALDALGSLEEIPADPARRKALFRAAAAEGLLPARPLARRMLAPLAALGAAAALLVAVGLAAGWWRAAPGPEPDDPGEVLVSPPDPHESLAPVAEVALTRGTVLLFREGHEPRPPKLQEPLFRKDRLVVEGRNAEMKLRFHEDALEMALLSDPKTGSGTEVRLEGSSEKRYAVHVDHGAVRGRFLSGPLEAQASRQEGDAVVPLVLTSPTARVEIYAGRAFDVRQEKANLLPNWFTYNPNDKTVSMRFESYDLHRLLTLHLRKAIDPLTLRVDEATLSSKSVTLLCNEVDLASLPSLLDAALGPQGLAVRPEGAGWAVVERPGGPVPAKPAWEDPAYGPFTLELTEGKAKLSSLNPEIPGGMFVYGGQIGRVLPGLDPSRPLTAAPLMVEALDLTLKGTFIERSSGRVALIGVREGGAERVRTVRRGEEVNGYRIEWVGWDRVSLSREGAEYELRIP